MVLLCISLITGKKRSFFVFMVRFIFGEWLVPNLVVRNFKIYQYRLLCIPDLDIYPLPVIYVNDFFQADPSF